MLSTLSAASASPAFLALSSCLTPSVTADAPQPAVIPITQKIAISKLMPRPIKNFTSKPPSMVIDVAAFKTYAFINVVQSV
ncbi:hypothetical protein D3C78_1882300 [compost metagenome]